MNPVDVRQIQWCLKVLARISSLPTLSEDDRVWLQAQQMVRRTDPLLSYQQLLSELRNIYNLKLITGRLTS